MRSTILIPLLCLFLLMSCDNSTNPLEEQKSWILQRDKQDDITYYAIFFADSQNGWIIGNNGTIKNSNDGGNTWQPQQSNISANLWDVSFVNKLNGWICGDKIILKTIDGGISWTDISPSTQEDKIYVTIKFIDKNNGWASSNTGEILSTSDGGQTWDIKKKGLLGGSQLSVIDLQTVYAYSGKLYKTFDGGDTWDSVEVPIPKNYMVSEITFINSNNGWIAIQNGSGGEIITEFPVLITKDNGTTWKSSEPLEEGGFMCVYFIDENIGWISGIKNIYKTINGGMTWELELRTEDNWLRSKDMHFVDKNNGWIITWNGEIYKYE